MNKAGTEQRQRSLLRPQRHSLEVFFHISERASGLWEENSASTEGDALVAAIKGRKEVIYLKNMNKGGVEAASILLDPDLPLRSIPAWSLCTRPALSLRCECIRCLCSVANTLLDHLQVWVVINELPWACYIYPTGIVWKLTPASFRFSLGSLPGDWLTLPWLRRNTMGSKQTNFNKTLFIRIGSGARTC